MTDVAGFAAAAYHRGAAYVNVATTLLAQVDAAVGGRPGSTCRRARTWSGRSGSRSAVLCDTETLATLAPGEWACGRGRWPSTPSWAGTPDASLLELPLDEQVPGAWPSRPRWWPPTSARAGRRAVLNYGHTLAHALEAAGFDEPRPPELRHGEAVAVGLVYAALLARRLGPDRRGAGGPAPRRWWPASTSRPTCRPAPTPAVLVEAMGRDKKAQPRPHLRPRRPRRGRNGAGGRPRRCGGYPAEMGRRP